VGSTESNEKADDKPGNEMEREKEGQKTSPGKGILGQKTSPWKNYGTKVWLWKSLGLESSVRALSIWLWKSLMTVPQMGQLW